MKLLDCATAGRGRTRELYAVHEWATGALVAAVDALGDDPIAATFALQTLSAEPQAGVAELLYRCHEQLKGTEGVELSLASFDVERGLLTWAGVGNVSGVYLSGERRHTLNVIGGVLGGSLAGIRTLQLPVKPLDLLVFATDGVRPDFVIDVDPTRECHIAAEHALLKWGRANDDALVVAARWRGP